MFKTVKKVIDWTGKYKKNMYWGFVGSFFVAIFTAIPVILAAYSLNHILMDINGEAQLPENFGWLMALGIGVSVILRFVFTHLRALAQESIGYETTADERLAIGNVLKRVSLGYFEENKTGDITATISTQLTFLENLGTTMVDMIVGGYITTGATILCLAFFCPQAAIISVVGVLLSLVFLQIINRLCNKHMSRAHKAQADMTRSVIEYLHGMSDVKSYGNEGAALDSIRNAFKNSRDISIELEKKYAPINAMHVLSLKLASCAIIVIVSILAINGGMPIAYAIMMLMFMFNMFSSIERLNDSTNVMGIIKSNIKNLNRLKEAEFIDADGKDIGLENYNIEFSDVTFAYDSVDVIKNVSFSAPEKSMTAIVGPSGGGKTTLCNLIARFYDVGSGSISIGGHNVKDLTCDSLLKNISMVFQKVYLFHDTIENNIRFGNPNASKEDIIEASKKARCHEFISAFSDGYDTVVGEGGSTLSGGEKQRISIARAILKDAPIVMLDEATASIDPENEHYIQGAINELTKGKTVLTIAHKLSTVKNADNIIVVKDGEINEQGKHEDLMRKDGVYKKFINIRKSAEGWSL